MLRFFRLVGLTALFALLGLLCFAGAALAATPADPAAPDITDDLGSWAALVGIALPAIVAVLQRVSFPSWVNALIFGAACVVASIVYGLIRFGTDISWAHWQGALLAIVVWGVGTYKTFWHPASKTDTVVAKLRKFPD